MNKAVLHDHLDGGLRAITAKELAIKDSYRPLLDVEAVSYTHLTLPTTPYV